MSVNTNYTHAVKKNLSSIQVLKTLQFLLEGNYTMAELVEKLNLEEDGAVFNNSVVSKYINTCRYCGILIPKIHNKYFVAKLPFGINLTAKELDLLEIMQNTAQKFMSSRAYKSLKTFIDKLDRYSNKQIIRVDNETIDETKNAFESAIQEQRYIRLMFKVKAIMDCIPEAITIHKGKQYFKVIHNGKEKLVTVDRVTGLEVLSKKFYQRDLDGETIIYKLTGKLAARYSIKDNEEIIDNKLPEYIVVANKSEVRELLISRLMRYDSLCEVIAPEDFRNEMRTAIEAALANYAK